MTGDSAGPHIGAGGLAELVFHYAHALAVAPSAAVYGELLSARSFAGTLLGRSAARQRPDLTVTAGWLSSLLAISAADLGEHAAGMTDARRRAATAMAQLGPPAPAASVYSVPRAEDPPYTATSLLLAGRCAEAAEMTRRIVDTAYRPQARAPWDQPTNYARTLLILALAAAGLGGLPVSVLTASDVTAFLAGMACIHAPGTPAASSLLICWLLARRLGCLKVVPSSPATPYSQYLARRLDR